MGLHMRNMATVGIKSWSTSVMALGQLSSGPSRTSPGGNASRPTMITLMIMMMLMASGFWAGKEMKMWRPAER